MTDRAEMLALLSRRREVVPPGFRELFERDRRELFERMRR